jgi:hypothetical protein
MDLEITPRPTEAERAAIVAALAEDEREENEASPWAAGILPQCLDTFKP